MERYLLEIKERDSDEGREAILVFDGEKEFWLSLSRCKVLYRVTSEDFKDMYLISIPDDIANKFNIA